MTDKDDWDLPDKTFYWEGSPHPSFVLNEDTGEITMLRRTLEGRYHLRFHVFDRKHTQRDIDVSCGCAGGMPRDSAQTAFQAPGVSANMTDRLCNYCQDAVFNPH